MVPIVVSDTRTAAKHICVLVVVLGVMCSIFAIPPFRLPHLLQRSVALLFILSVLKMLIQEVRFLFSPAILFTVDGDVMTWSDAFRRPRVASLSQVRQVFEPRIPILGMRYQVSVVFIDGSLWRLACFNDQEQASQIHKSLLRSVVPGSDLGGG